MSRNAKIALVVMSALVVICVGICGIGYFLLPRLSENVFSQNPTNAKRVGAGIADYTLPAGYSEVMGVDILVYKMVAIERSKQVSDGMVFMLLGTQQAGVSQAEMERQMQQAFQQQFNRSGGSTHVVAQESIVIRGQATTLTVAETDAQPPFRQAVGTFQGKHGLVIVMVMGSQDEWDDAVMREFLGSIE